MTPEEQTIAARGTLQVRNTVQNLRRVTELGCITLAGKPWRDATVFIVGAGPSLDHNGHLLRAAQERGPVVCVNTSLGACLKHGVEPDYVVTMENVDVSSHLDAMPIETRLIVALSAHPRIWDVAESDAGFWFPEANPQTFELCYDLDVMPIAHGGAALTAAVSVAETLGAIRIVLVGCDLAMGQDGAAYASGSGWDGIRAELDGDKMTLVGREDREAVHKASGAPPVYRNPDAIRVPGWGGGEVVTKRDYLCQRDWLSSRTRGSLKVNATEGGASIPGWSELALESVLGDVAGRWEPIPWEAVSKADAEKARASMARNVEAARRYVVSLEQGRPDWDALVTGFPIVEAMGSSDLQRLQWMGLDKQAHIRALYSIINAAADEVERCLI